MCVYKWDVHINFFLFPKKLAVPELQTLLKATFLFGRIHFSSDHCSLEILCVIGSKMLAQMIKFL